MLIVVKNHVTLEDSGLVRTASLSIERLILDRQEDPDETTTTSAFDALPISTTLVGTNGRPRQVLR